MIETILFDIDGILTDGTVTIDPSGNSLKKMCFDDIDAIFELKRAGIKIGFITGEHDHFVRHIEKKFQPDFFFAGCKDKLGALQTLIRDCQIDISSTAYVGDSKKDVEILKNVKYSFAPSNAIADAKESARVVLKSERGCGVVREVVDFFLSNKSETKQELTPGKWNLEVWKTKINEHIEVINAINSDADLISMISHVGEILASVYRSGGNILFCGNGGSAADAQHLAAELVGRFAMERAALNAEALTANMSSITAIGNDYSYDIVFSRQVEGKGHKGDALVGLSTSGCSQNVVKAMEAARKKGMITIGIVGANKNAEITRFADYCIHMPSLVTARIQESYLLVGHLLCEYIETSLFGKNSSMVVNETRQ